VDGKYIETVIVTTGDGAVVVMSGFPGVDLRENLDERA
jgi:hypothetical protein